MPKRVAWIVALFLVAAACSADEQPGAGSSTPEVVSSVAISVSPTASLAPSATPTSQPGTTVAPVSSSSTTSTTLPIAELELTLVEIARGFEQPVLAISPPEDARLYIVDQPGEIWVIADGEPSLFVDLKEDVIFGGERGLLGLAFHPDFADNRRLFVNYIGEGGRTRIVELTAAADGLSADRTSQQILLEVGQPARNHNGGMLAFGPDGYLWVATGDGGGSNDEFDQGQRSDTLLGALLRLDVSQPGEYSVPGDNPFVGGDAPEVAAFGLRNPWRFAFDGDALFIADVGQRSFEEINVVAATDAIGANFGWPIYEGNDCFRGPCDTTGLVSPVLEYSHSDGCSITGGFVYRGSLVPELTGHYFYADFCSGWIRSLSPDGAPMEWFSSSGSRPVTSFGQDAAGEIYVVVRNGSIFRIERA